MLTIRVVTLDYYISKPINELYTEEEKKDLIKEWQEPVIRIFGPTPEGVKCCAHIHGVYPYIYIPYFGGENPNRDALLLGAALDEALKSTTKTKYVRFVYKLTLVSGIPLYGYHSNHRQFFKIYFYNPYYIRKASELLLNGAILGQKFQPHEAHIPFTLQFMMDYNIYGMSFISFSKAKYRRNPENPISLTSVGEEDLLSHKIKKATCSYWELDVLERDITNKNSQKVVGVNPGLQAIWEDEIIRRRAQNRESQITAQESDSRPDVKLCPSEIMYKEQLAEKLRAVVPGRTFHSAPESDHASPESGDLLGDENIEEKVVDASSLIDERIITQIMTEEKAKEESESEEEDALGRNQKEEAELEDEDGVDMTQPLDFDDIVEGDFELDRDEAGDNSDEPEDLFWRNMADKILQLDGAVESSASESDVEASPSMVPTEGGPLDAPELTSEWSGNIMSILSEDSGCPTPSTVCQTPQTFWSNYSPNWLPEQDSWNFDLGKTQTNDLSRDFDFFGSEDFPSVSSPSIILTPDSANINLESICGSPQTVPYSPEQSPAGLEVKHDNNINTSTAINSHNSNSNNNNNNNTVVSSANNNNINNTVKSDREKLMKVLKSFADRQVPSEDNQLTLKQYIKDCREIVSVDFKNLCNREMVIIEYKSINKKSVQNKYLIKPLDKFLENWTSAEKRVQFSKDSSKSGCYNINENVISQGKIKMKLIKSQRSLKFEEISKPRSEKHKILGLRKGRKEGERVEKRGGKNFTKMDTKLIKEINSSFEEYFKNLVKRKNICARRQKCDLSEEESSEEDQGLNKSDPIKFVTRFLSTFSRMSDIPPLSITISLGKGSTTPVQLNLQPTVQKESKYKKHRRKIKIENVDGPAGSSSSEEDTKQRVRGQKKSRRDGYYKPLNVIVHGSPGKSGRKRKICEGKDDAGRKSSCTSADSKFCSPKPNLSKSRRKKEKRPSEFLVKPNDDKTSTLEPDFIYDSDEERGKTVRKCRKWPKLNAKAVLTKIPQIDVEAVTSSEDDRPTKPEHEIMETPEDVPAKSLDLNEARLMSNVEDVMSMEITCGQLSPEDNDQRRDVAGPSGSHQPDSPFVLSGSPLFSSRNYSPEVFSRNWSPESSPDFEFCQINLSSEMENLSGSTPDEGILTWVVGDKTITPAFKPPTKTRVLKDTERVEDSELMPFWSSPSDLPKPLEIGPRVLKIPNRTIASLKSFKSSLGISSMEEMKMKFGVGVHQLSNKEVTITPLEKPPSPRTVLKCSTSKNEPLVTEIVKNVKIVKGLSSDEDSEEEMEMSMKLSLSQTSSPSATQKPEEEEVLKKGPLSKIKGMKKLSVLNKLEVISEEAAANKESSRQSASPTPVSSKGSKKNSDSSFQIRGVTLENTFGFSRSVENVQNAKLSPTHQYVTMLVMELHVQTRSSLLPDPDHDPIRALFYAVTFDSPTRDEETGVIVVGDQVLTGTAISGHSVHYEATEKALVEKFLSLVKAWDPDILAGYEIEMHSWGYLVQRSFVLEMNLLHLLGRVNLEECAQQNTSNVLNLNDEVDDIPRNIRHMKITGRIVLDIWRVLRHEVALTSYTFENVMYHFTHERHPLVSYENLSHYWEHPTCRFRHIVADHFFTRVKGVIKILDQIDFLNQTSELSRLFGIQFYEVLSRGSQFRVESMMLRLAKPLDYIPVSPSIAQRAAMRAPGSLPLILEPESLFYPDPIIVLDFQSLYPSVIIAYNYCFSTCLGRVEKLGGLDPFEFGCTELQISPEELKSLEKNLTISPVGVAFVKPTVRKGVLPTMLEEILETRLMVKKSMKENKSNKILQKVLFARQLGLKLIANVTYGYTAANFSGRMPCIEVGDSVVSKGRETLHRAIQLVKNTPEWGARVVYGDTDSLFVMTPGKSREEAFRIGAEIADAVTKDNPKPVKLKLEKVYQPSILQTKKRYLGYMYESPDQEKPVFEAKGIETVRRDGCPATGKILQKALQILFDTRDVSLVKKYTIRQFAKLFQGRVNLQDLIFAKEYRGRKGYRPGACVPALQLARQWTQRDKRAEPRVKERVPYVIVNGPPGVPLIRLVRSPREFISDPSLRINAVYYITKAIVPPMQRCFSLLGADVLSWYSEMPRKYHRMHKWTRPEGQKKTTISQYFATVECTVCSKISHSSVCPECEKRPQVLAVTLNEKIRQWERCHHGILRICQACCGRPTEIDCESLDCPVLFRRYQAARDFDQSLALREVLTQYI